MGAAVSTRKPTRTVGVPFHEKNDRPLMDAAFTPEICRALFLQPKRLLRRMTRAQAGAGAQADCTGPSEPRELDEDGDAAGS